MKAVLYAANTSSQTAVSGAVINFGNVVRKTGCNCYISGGNAVVQGAGYYNINVNVTAAATTSGSAVFTVLKDGVYVPGAIATASVAADDIITISIPAVIKQTCGCESVITVTMSGVTATINNAAIVVDKI